MIYSGITLTLNKDTFGIAELQFIRQDSQANKLDRQTLNEIRHAISYLKQESDVCGLIMSSARSVFMDSLFCTELPLCNMDKRTLIVSLLRTHSLFSSIEKLPFPTVAVINGEALGGGFEIALACDFRVLSDEASVGFPDINFGVHPVLGGTVRFSRLVGIKKSLEWILSGKAQCAKTALLDGAVDKVVKAEVLNNQSWQFLLEKIEQGPDYPFARLKKQVALQSKKTEICLLERDLKTFIGKDTFRNPATEVIIELIHRHSLLDYGEALVEEVKTFSSLAYNTVAKNLIGLFHNERSLEIKTQKFVSKGNAVSKVAVVGAGILGGEIAFQSASAGIPVLMKEISELALEFRLVEGCTQLNNQGVKAQILSSIGATLDYCSFGEVDLVVEAVVDNSKTKGPDLADVEQSVCKGTVLTSNTSTISINHLASSLQNPENYCGLHFFNPVSLMPLVEVVKGALSSDQAIASTVAYAISLGKTPVVVNDCPGLLVHRVLIPYFNSFNRLLMDGVDFQRIDKVMEGFGWPVGPAGLLDEIGIDTVVKGNRVMVEGFPERMGHEGITVIEELLANNIFGEKNGSGFYFYDLDKSKCRTKKASELVYALIDKVQETTITSRLGLNGKVLQRCEIGDDEIIERMMTPLCLEAIHCLEEGIVETSAEVDVALVLGLGFPRFLGGPLRYIDNMGMPNLCSLVWKYRHLGQLYQLTPGMKKSPRKQFYN